MFVTCFILFKEELRMSELRYPALFEPFKIGKVEIKNKVVMSPLLAIGWFDEHSVISDK